ncbi:sensor histidine kinase [Allorhizocola rhizosphaerae]|uniref:sensor histidine kinase n=1 Tax=Allorhizocola rhizosphaerae TaxID=1872709 RepID=UPI001B8BE844|nr:histidine kinase [Allorhizocola rhizosphaerae]
MARRDILIDGALAAAVTLVIAVAVTADLGGGRGPDVTAYMFAIGLGLLMLVRRRHPVLALIATGVGLIGYHALDYPPVGLAVPVAAALYSAAEHGKTRLAVGVALALLAVSNFFRLRDGEDPGYLIGFELAWSVAMMAAAIALGDSVRNRRRLRQEGEREAAIRMEQERLAIARDLHDVLAHTITVISLQSDVAREALDDADAAAARTALALIRTASDEAGDELRTTVALLRRPADAAIRSPTASLRNLGWLARTMGDNGLPVTVRTEGEPVPLPGIVDTTAYRIVQESLTNALRHAGASRVEVVLRYGRHRLDVDIIDDGHGHGRDADGDADGDGHGLAGMRERAELVGGKLTTHIVGNGGSTVSASLPIEGRQ